MVVVVVVLRPRKSSTGYPRTAVLRITTAEKGITGGDRTVKRVSAKLKK